EPGAIDMPGLFNFSATPPEFTLADVADISARCANVVPVVAQPPRLLMGSAPAALRAIHNIVLMLKYLCHDDLLKAVSEPRGAHCSAGRRTLRHLWVAAVASSLRMPLQAVLQATPERPAGNATRF